MRSGSVGPTATTRPESRETKNGFSSSGPKVERSRRSTGPPRCRRTRRCRSLGRTAKLRWRIERDYEELKDEIGLDHYEGRGRRGFHNHATLCKAAYVVLAVERCLSPPQAFPSSAFHSRSLPYPKASVRGELPIRTQRHVAQAIATLRIRIALLFVQEVSRYPCCLRPRTEPRRIRTDGATFITQ